MMAMSYAAESIQPTRGNGWRGGVASEIEAIDVAQVAAFWRAQFTPRNARIIVVGDYDPRRLRARIERSFGALPAGTAPRSREPANATVTGTLVMGDAPSAVALAVSAPAPSAPDYAAFLILAARLLGHTSPDWTARYDPLSLPETLFVTGPVRSTERPEAAADRIRTDIARVLAGPRTPRDVAAARDRFGLLLGLHQLEPASCRRDPRALAVARARRAQLGLDELPLARTLAATTQEQLAEAAARFDSRRSAAVIAGGTIR
jgi:hypothetical protein